jgi:ergothioneine biosynthesis protein EgtB
MTSYAVTISSTLAARFAEVRRTTERLCAPLSAEDQMVQPMPDASPAKWHQAHTTWFFETFILLPHVPGYRAFDERFTYVFNSYYKQLRGHPVRANRGFMSRPSLEEVHAYRAHVDAAMQSLLATNLTPEVAALVEIGLNHEQQHQELIVTDVKYALWSQPLRPAYREPNAGFPRITRDSRDPLPDSTWLDFAEGISEIGYAGDGFCFDNETPRHKVLLNPFSLASRLVTNREYLEFIRDGGYSNPALWLSDAWDTINAQNWRAPLYWEEHDGQWFTFTLEGMKEVDSNEPVCHVSYYEADAFARWAGARLPLEAEWEIAAERTLKTAPLTGNVLDTDLLHPTAAPASHGDSLTQLFGDVWEWTASPYTAYPGFQPAAGALGEYNGKFMCNQFVLRGGSCATPQSHIRASYRNFFPPHARWQFMGIRLAK